MSWAIAIAIQARWRWPPESWSTGRSRRSCHPGQVQGVVNRVVVGLRWRLHERLVRIAATAHEVRDRDSGDHDRLLREQAEPLRHLARGVVVDYLAVEQHRSPRLASAAGQAI